jgi:peptide deformylase
MTLAIAQLGQPVLRRLAEPVPPHLFGVPDFLEFLEAMQATLVAAGGAGLAAPQVFVSRRVYLARVAPPPPHLQPLSPEGGGAGGEGEPEVFVNPRLVALSKETAAAWEGCLSFPELLVLVSRPRRVRVEYFDPYGRPKTLDLEGFPARVVQHEYDHLDGVLTLDRAASPRDIVKASEIEAVLRDRGEGDA